MNLDEIFRPRARVNVFTSERVGNPRCVAVVEDAGPGGVVLTVDPDDLREAEIGQGDAIQLGFGVVELGMHYTCDTTVRAISGDRVEVAYPSPPQKRPRRSYARAPMDWPCALTLTGAGTSATLSGVTLNVSASGALIVLEEEPGPLLTDGGAAARVELRPAGRPPFECAVEIARVGVPGVAGRARPLVAVRYRDLPEEAEMRLQLLVLRAIARRYLRCRVALPCRFQVGEGQAPLVVEVVSENLSGSGLLLVGSAPAGAPPLSRGQRGALRIQLAGARVSVEVAEITRVEDRGENRVGLALSYVTIAREQRTAIVELVMERVRDV